MTMSRCVFKTGFEQLVTILAQDYALLYGAMAVLVSRCYFGWYAGFFLQSALITNPGNEPLDCGNPATTIVNKFFTYY
jgi:hypothetical protein